jgi:phosphoribosylaminoimidazole (AIR) synthetase
MLYNDSGVDRDLGNEVVRKIKSLAESTFSPRVLTTLGGFTACYSLDHSGHLRIIMSWETCSEFCPISG